MLCSRSKIYFKFHICKTNSTTMLQPQIRATTRPPTTPFTILTTTSTTTTTTTTSKTSTVSLKKPFHFPESGRSREEAYYPKDIREDCHPPNRLCEIPSCVNDLGQACSHCLSPETPCNDTCDDELTFCPEENKCVPKVTCQKLTSFQGATDKTGEARSTLTLIGAVLGVVGLVIILSMLVLVLLKRRRSEEPSTRMRKVVKKEKVEYRVTVERVHAETNEYYGRDDDDEDEEDEWAETAENNPYYGEDNANKGSYDLNVNQKNEYYGQ